MKIEPYKYQKLIDHLQDEHGLILIINEVEEIESCIEKDLMDYTHCSTLLNNSLKEGNPVIYEREIYIIRFVDFEAKTIDIESIDECRYKSFLPLDNVTKIVL